MSSSQINPDSSEISQIIQNIPHLLDIIREARSFLLRNRTRQPPQPAAAAADNIVNPTTDNSPPPPATPPPTATSDLNAKAENGVEKGSCLPLGNKKQQQPRQTEGQPTEGSQSTHNQVDELDRQMEKLEKDLKYISFAFGRLHELEDNVGKQFKSLMDQSDVLKKVIAKIPHQELPGHILEANVRVMNEMVMKVKLQIPSQHLMNFGQRRMGKVSGVDARNLLDKTLNLHASEGLKGCSVYSDFVENYKSLGDGKDGSSRMRLRLCCLCFALFPEGAMVTRRMLMYWWVGEGFIGDWIDKEEELAEDVADGILKEFVTRRLVEPVTKKRRLVAFKMSTLVHSSVVSLAERVGFFDFDSAGYPTAKFLHQSGKNGRSNPSMMSCMRACLVETDKGYSRDELTESKSDADKKKMESKLDPFKLHALFNVNDPYPDLKPEWFLQLVNLQVLCLGRCDNLSNKKFTDAEENEIKSHTEVESTEFLLGLKNMKRLRYLSFQGVSRISELPNTVGNLPCLRILDLNACHTLEIIPNKIVLLKSLTHLDVSECYLLDFMPKGLGSLSELQVLKGFVISDLETKHSGTLQDLAGLSKLRKLSIYTSKKSFPTDQELDALYNIAALKKLTIIWGGGSHSKLDSNGSTDTPTPSGPHKVTKGSSTKSGTTEQAPGNLERSNAFNVRLKGLPERLEKLDLQCYPGTDAPSWLLPDKLDNLKKLYLRGGDLCNLGQNKWRNSTWNVEILRLKFLFGLSMEWRKLQLAFPKLVYLEKVRCPRLTFFPTDESGVWVSKDRLAKEKQEKLGLSWSFLASRFT